MKRPDIDEHALVRVSIGLDKDFEIDDYDPPLSDAEKWWYNAMKADREQFAKDHPDLHPIWEIPFDYS